MTGTQQPDISQTTALPEWTDVRENAGLITAKIDSQGGRERWVAISRDLFGGGDADDEESRDWMFDSFLGFRGAMQPFLDELFSDDRLDEQTDHEGLSAE